MKTYAGIGSRRTPPNILREMTLLAKKLEQQGYTLHSGAAAGADRAFALGCNNKIEFIPFSGFNKCYTGVVVVTEDSLYLASTLHPAWSNLSEPAKKLMARNCHQVLGLDLQSPVEFVLCWTPDGAEKETSYETGGTGQAIRLAVLKNIEVINMANEGWSERLETLTERGVVY